jgi:hypothetical protein
VEHDDLHHAEVVAAAARLDPVVADVGRARDLDELEKRPWLLASKLSILLPLR